VEHAETQQRPDREALPPRASAPVAAPARGGAEVMLALQSSAGNQAVARMLAVRDRSLQRQPPSGSSTAAPAAPGQLSVEEQAFFNLTVEAGSRIALATGKFSSWLSSITIPYALAWTAHKNALKAADEASKNANAIVLGAVLAMIPGGVGGAIGKGMKNLGAGDWMVDGVKDLAKYGLREGGRGATSPGSTPHGASADPAGALPSTPSTAPSGGQAFNAMPTDPLVWQNQTNQRAEAEVLTPAREHVAHWQRAVNTHDANFDLNFDPVQAVNDSLKLDGKSLFDLTDEAAEPLLKGYEKGFLNDWIMSEASAVYGRNSQFSWGKVRDKLISYGKSIGFDDIQTVLDSKVSADIDEHNKKVIASGHGLI
jgi:hypothetical protein